MENTIDRLGIVVNNKPDYFGCPWGTVHNSRPRKSSSKDFCGLKAWKQEEISCFYSIYLHVAGLSSFTGERFANIDASPRS